jgi:hypothetical protein
VEGNSLRSTTRITGRSINTVTKLLVELGKARTAYQMDVPAGGLHLFRVLGARSETRLASGDSDPGTT